MAWAFMVLTALGGTAGMLWRELHKHKEADADPVATTTKASKKQLTFTSAPAAACIPHDELAALEAFLRKVYRWRGWKGGAYHVTQAWHQVETAAAGKAAGCWLPDFDLLQVTDANCNVLLDVIDATFFGGKMLKKLTAKQKQQHQQQQSDGSAGGSSTSSIAASRVVCKVVQSYGHNGTWLAYFDVSNIIFINQWRWNKTVSEAHPLNVEGVVCTSRLQMLLHTLAHELVHAIVFHIFPEMDRRSPAYLTNERHGPIFQLLNKQLFGHSSDALKQVQVLPCRP